MGVVKMGVKDTSSEAYLVGCQQRKLIGLLRLNKVANRANQLEYLK